MYGGFATSTSSDAGASGAVRSPRHQRHRQAGAPCVAARPLRAHPPLRSTPSTRSYWPSSARLSAMHPLPGAHVGHDAPRRARQHQLHQPLGLGPRDEHAPVHVRASGDGILPCRKHRPRARLPPAARPRPERHRPVRSTPARAVPGSRRPVTPPPGRPRAAAPRDAARGCDRPRACARHRPRGRPAPCRPQSRSCSSRLAIRSASISSSMCPSITSGRLCTERLMR